MPVHLVYKEDSLKAELLGDIDDHTAKEMRESIDTAAKRLRPNELELDFSGISFMDSSGIGLIIGRYKLMKMWNGSVILSGMSKRIEMIVRLSGAEKLVQMERREKNAG